MTNRTKPIELRKYLEGKIKAIYQDREKSEDDVLEKFLATDLPGKPRFSDRKVRSSISSYFTQELGYKRKLSTHWDFEFLDRNGTSYGICYTFINRDHDLTTPSSVRFLVTLNKESKVGV